MKGRAGMRVISLPERDSSDFAQDLELQNYFEKVWRLLDEALDRIFHCESPGQAVSYERLYRATEDVCKLGHSKECFSLVRTKLERYISGTLKPELLDQCGDEPKEVLDSVEKAWIRWTDMLHPIGQTLSFLDRFYLLKNSLPSVQNTGYLFFKSRIFDDPVLREKILEGACRIVAPTGTWVAREDDQRSSDRVLFRKALSLFHELGVYGCSFEPRFFKISSTYFRNWAERSIQESSLPEYVNRCLELLEGESQRCKHFEIPGSTRRELMELVLARLVTDQKARLVADSPVRELLQKDAVRDLQRLYDLLQRSNLGVQLAKPFEAWIEDAGFEILNKQDPGQDIIENLLHLRRQLDRIWRVSFSRDESIGHVLKLAFERIMKTPRRSDSDVDADQSMLAEMISKHITKILTSPARSRTSSYNKSRPGTAMLDHEDEEASESSCAGEDPQMMDEIDQTLDLFRFIQGKMAFEAFYKRDLAQRLLHTRPINTTAERCVISRLKTECGPGFTHKIELMFWDIANSADEVHIFRAQEASQKKADEENQRNPEGISQPETSQTPSAPGFNVKILSSGAWPSYPDIPMNLPPDLKAAHDEFANFYHSRHKGRKLIWKHGLASALVRARFPIFDDSERQVKNTVKELVVSGMQAIVLIFFNSIDIREKVEYPRLRAETGLLDHHLKRTLQSLTCSKVRPLVKRPPGTEIETTDTFSINLHFTHDRFRIQANMIRADEVDVDKQRTRERVSADRQLEIQATVVRIMKVEKIITHERLVQHLAELGRAKGSLYSIEDIKNCIDRLIDQDYIERVQDNRYRYLA